jgi:hypothetical protein
VLHFRIPLSANRGFMSAQRSDKTFGVETKSAWLAGLRLEARTLHEAKEMRAEELGERISSK